jgi:glycosyltransferase involved in cell wall biosynthesis
MIRVLNIIDTMSSGGVERRRLSLAKLLDKTKFELKIICTNAVGSFPDEFKKYDVEIIVIGDLKSFLDIKQHQKVIQIINEFKPHIIHGAVFEGVTMAAINGFYKRVPIIILEETSDPQNRRWKGNLLMKLLCLSADKVIGVSPAAQKYLENKINLPKDKVVLINNGVVIPIIVSEETKKSIKEKHEIFDDEIVIGSVGRMNSDAHKRFSDLIHAFSIVAKKSNRLKLVLVGDGPEKSNYENLATQLGIQNQVVFAGYQNEIGSYYSIFDVFCLVSAFEAFGLVLAEAMLHKLPVVATNVGGMKYIVEDNVTGFLVEKLDVNAISEKLDSLVQNADLRKRLGENGYSKAMKNYTEDRYVKNVAELYQELILKKQIKLLK